MTDSSLEDANRYPYFYTTVPDDHFLNKVRQDLLEHFGWRRVGIFSAEDEYHVSVSTIHRAIIKLNCSMKILCINYTFSVNTLLYIATIN